MRIVSPSHTTFESINNHNIYDMGKEQLGSAYEILLCTPGMNENVKIDVKISRKTALLLNAVIESGIDKEQAFAQELLKLVPRDEIAPLQQLANDCLEKAGLREVSEKMRVLTGK